MNNFFAVLKLGLVRHTDTEMIVSWRMLFLISFWKKYIIIPEVCQEDALLFLQWCYSESMYLPPATSIVWNSTSIVYMTKLYMKWFSWICWKQHNLNSFFSPVVMKCLNIMISYFWVFSALFFHFSSMGVCLFSYFCPRSCPSCPSFALWYRACIVYERTMAKSLSRLFS